MGVQVQVASLWWQDMDPRDDRVWVEPDLAVDLSSADYIAGRDPMLQAIVDYKHEEIAARVGELALKGDKAAALTAVKAWSADPRRKYVTAESDLRFEAALGERFGRPREHERAAGVGEHIGVDDPDARQFGFGKHHVSKKSPEIVLRRVIPWYAGLPEAR